MSFRQFLMFLCNVKGLTLHRTWAGVLGHNREAVHPYINGGSTGIVLIQQEVFSELEICEKKTNNLLNQA